MAARRSRRWFWSFYFALRGLFRVWRGERNMRVHAAAASLVSWAAWAAELEPVQWGILVVLIALVMVGEMLNTVVEAVVDLQVEEYHPTAEVAKDAMAGGVLLTAMAALGVGYLFFGSILADLPRLFYLRAVEDPFITAVFAVVTSFFLAAALVAVLNTDQGGTGYVE